MHYKDGTPVKIGDLVRGEDYNGRALVGEVIATYAGAQTCNIVVATSRTIGSNETCYGGAALLYKPTSGADLVIVVCATHTLTSKQCERLVEAPAAA
jgi:hypothetical protein